MCLLIVWFNRVMGDGLISPLPAFQAQEMTETLSWDKRRESPGANLREWPILVSLSEKRKSVPHSLGPKLNLNSRAKFLQSSVGFYWSSVEWRGERWRKPFSWWRVSNKAVLFLGNELKGVTYCLVTFSHICTQNLWLQVWALDRKQDVKSWFDYAGKWINGNCRSQIHAVRKHTHFYRDVITIVFLSMSGCRGDHWYLRPTISICSCMGWMPVEQAAELQ